MVIPHLKRKILASNIKRQTELLKGGILGSRIPDIFFQKSGHFESKQRVKHNQFGIHVRKFLEKMSVQMEWWYPSICEESPDILENVPTWEKNETGSPLIKEQSQESGHLMSKHRVRGDKFEIHIRTFWKKYLDKRENWKRKPWTG